MVNMVVIIVRQFDNDVEMMSCCSTQEGVEIKVRLGSRQEAPKSALVMACCIHLKSISGKLT